MLASVGVFVEYLPVRKMSKCCFSPHNFPQEPKKLSEYKTHPNWVNFSNTIRPQNDATVDVGAEKKTYSPQPTKSPSVGLKTGPVSRHHHCVYLRLQSRRGTRFIYRIHQRYPAGFGAGIVTAAPMGICLWTPPEVCEFSERKKERRGCGCWGSETGDNSGWKVKQKSILTIQNDHMCSF